jgi:hypothetical protein
MKYLLLALIFFTSQSPAQQAPAWSNAQTEVLRIHGSNTVGAHLAPKLVQAWMQSRGWQSIEKSIPATDELTLQARKPDGRLLRVELKAHGSSTGIENLMLGMCDVAMASRSVTAKERSLNFEKTGFDLARSEHVIALDGVAVVVHRNNPLGEIDLPTLRAIFNGTQKSWGNITGRAAPIRLLARDAKSGTFDAFNASVPRGDLISNWRGIPSVNQLIVAMERWGVSVAALARSLFEAKIVGEWHYRELSKQISIMGYRSKEPRARAREESILWKKVFESLWKEGVIKDHVAKKLCLPPDEMDALFGGLYGENKPLAEGHTLKSV